MSDVLQAARPGGIRQTKLDLAERSFPFETISALRAAQADIPALLIESSARGAQAEHHLRTLAEVIGIAIEGVFDAMNILRLLR